MGDEVLPLNVQKALDVIYKTQGFTLDDLRKPYRHARLCNTRQWLAYFLNKEFGYTQREVAILLNKDRTTGYAMIAQVESLLRARDRAMREIKKSFMEVWKNG